MNVIVQSFLYCCLLATVAHCVELEVNSQLKKRLSIWLESRMRRNLNSVSVGKTEESEHLVRPGDIRETLLPHSSTDTSVRTKRSKNSANQSRRQGCSLGTCAVHDLAHRLHQLNNNFKTGTAPTDKISAHGYGRRRRSLPAQRQRQRQRQGQGQGQGQGQDRPEWRITDSQVHKLMALLKRT